MENENVDNQSRLANRVTLVCCYNDKAEFFKFKKSIDMQTENAETIGIDNTVGQFSSCAKALNSVIEQIQTRYVIFSHQDIELTDNDTLRIFVDQLNAIEETDLLGVAGAVKEGCVNRVYSNIIHGIGDLTCKPGIRILDSEGRETNNIIQCETVDECFFGGATSFFREHPFDEEICDAWHLYAVEMCLFTRSIGGKVYSSGVEMWHKSQGSLSPDYFECIYRLAEKYENRIAYITTTCSIIGTDPLFIKEYKENREKSEILLRRSNCQDISVLTSDNQEILLDNITIKIAKRMNKLILILFPPGSKRREIFKKLWESVKKIGIIGKSSYKSKRSSEVKKTEIIKPKYEVGFDSCCQIDVLSSKQTLFIAKLIKWNLNKVGIACEINLNEPESYKPIPYIVICPHIFRILPEVYIAYQMEQTVSTRWIDDEYYNRLYNACAVLDYSRINVDFFSKDERVSNKLYYIPIGYYKDYENAGCIKKEYDVVFYGDTRCPRRKMFLDEIAKHFNVKYLMDVYEGELYEEISKAKVIVNIHYYENAILETTRIYEALSLNCCMIVSERGTDPELETNLEGIVDFTDIGNIEQMVERIGFWINNEDSRISKIEANRKALEKQTNSFDNALIRCLEETGVVMSGELAPQIDHRVSVIIPCFNDGTYIEECIESVDRQTYKNIEIVVIDDGSDDGYTRDIIYSISKKRKDISVLYTTHRGVAYARNFGIAYSHGEYILPLDADDKIEPTYLEKAVKILTENEKVGAVYCKADMFGEICGPWNLPPFSIRRELLENIVFVSGLYRKKDWLDIGGYSLDMKYGLEDYDFWLSILEKDRQIVQIPEVLFHYRQKKVSRSKKINGSYEKNRDSYRLIYQRHKKLYEKYMDTYISDLRDSWVERSF